MHSAFATARASAILAPFAFMVSGCSVRLAIPMNGAIPKADFAPIGAGRRMR